jgi:glucokinase
MVLGIDIGGTNTEFAVVDSTKGIVHIEKIKTKSHNSFLSYIENFTDMVKDLTKKFNISSIGIGAPNFDSGSNTFCPVNFNWSDVSPFNLEKHLEHEVSILSSVVNDANAVALAENRYGIGRNVNSFIIITIGTGLGAGIVINNHLFDGSYGSAGEFGHTKVEGIDRNCNCGGFGCLETVVSANGIKRTITEKLKLNSSEEAPDIRSVFEKAKQGDAICKETLEYTFQVLGKKLSDLIHILTPEAIVFCGNISKSLDSYMSLIKKECERNLLNNMRGKTNYIVSDLLNKKMNLLGPASLAFNKKLDFA